MSSVLDLFLYLFQQAGVLVGAGAAGLGLVWYLRDLHRSGRPHDVRAARAVETAALVLMILTGVIITALHWTSGEYATVLSPAFLFKWFLIAVLVICAVLRGRTSNFAWLAVAEGISGSQWLTLLLINYLAPVTTWSFLLSLWGGWLVFFALLWTGCILVLHHGPAVHIVLPKIQFPKAPQLALVSQPIKALQPKPVLLQSIPEKPAPASVPKVEEVASIVPEVPPEAPLPEIFHPKPAQAPTAVHEPSPPPKPLEPQAPVAHVPAPAPTPPPAPVIGLKDEGLPALRVMPKRPEDIKEADRGPVVEFD